MYLKTSVSVLALLLRFFFSSCLKQTNVHVAYQIIVHDLGWFFFPFFERFEIIWL